jgi:hypothetical protein
MKYVFYILITFISLSATQGQVLENSNQKAKPFSRWKNELVVEAQNKVVRLSNLMLLIKTERHSIENSLPLVAKENKQDISIPENQQEELITQAESQLKEAVAALEFAKELTLKDYFSVYLQQFKDDPSTLETLATEMDKKEIAEILMSLIHLQNSGPVTTSLIRVPGLDKPVENTLIGNKSRSPSKL